LQLNLFGSLSATGKGHGTERAALAGLVGKEPATVDPKFLDGLRDKPDQVFPVKLGNKSIDVSLKDVIYDATKGDFKHPNTMTVKFLAGNEVLLEQEYYSVGGGFIEWKGYTPPTKNPPKYPFRTMKELRAHADTNKTTIAKIMLANEMSITGKSEAEVYAFIDKIINAMVATVKSGLSMSEDDVLPGPIKLHSKAATVYKRAVDDNAAESALEHHLGMTCDPVAGYVQVPCIERCAFGAAKAWTAYAIASNEVASRHRVDFDATAMALAETAKDMNTKYKETSEAGLALSVTLC